MSEQEKTPKQSPPPKAGASLVLVARALRPIAFGSREDGISDSLQPGQMAHVSRRNVKNLNRCEKHGYLRYEYVTEGESRLATPAEAGGHEVRHADRAAIAQLCDTAIAHACGTDSGSAELLGKRMLQIMLTWTSKELKGRTPKEVVIDEEEAEQNNRFAAEEAEIDQELAYASTCVQRYRDQKIAEAKAALAKLESEQERYDATPIAYNVSQAHLLKRVATNDEQLSAAENAIREAKIREWKLNAQRRLEAYLPAVDGREARGDGEGLRPIFERAKAAFEQSDVGTFNAACCELHEALRPVPREGHGSPFAVRL